MTGLTLMQQGTFTSDGNSRRIDLQGSSDFFTVLNHSELAATNDVNFRFAWLPNLNDGQAIVTLKTGGTNTTQETLATTGGFTYRESIPTPEAVKTGTTITAAAPAVCSAVAHGYAVGDKVRIYNNTVMKQIAGMVFEVTAVGGANEFTIGYLDASGFAGAESAFSVRRIQDDLEVLPGARFITKITQAASAVVTFSESHPYKVGDVMYFRVSSDFGMVEIDQLQGKVTAISTSTVTLDINSAGFSAFAFPLLTDVPFSFAMGGMVGKRGLYDDWFSSSRTLLDLNPYRDGLTVPYMHLPGGQGSPAGADTNVITWQSWRSQ